MPPGFPNSAGSAGQGAAAPDLNKPEPVEVSFRLAMDPDHTFDAQMRDVALNTDVLENAGPQVLVTADVDRDALPRLRPGASVLANIHCGRRSIGFVWLHDLWDAARTRLFF